MYMYTEDDTMTPRDRISDDMLRRMLDGAPALQPQNPHGLGSVTQDAG